MKSELVQGSLAPSLPVRAGGWRTRLGIERLVLGRLERLESGTLTLESRGRRVTVGAPAAPGDRIAGPDANLTVHDDRFWTSIALRGSVGAGEAYAKGWWTSPDPTAVVRLFARNETASTGLEAGVAALSRPFLALYHGLRRNTRSGSRANIQAHYDLSNEFFRLFLDETMSYSCGIFASEETSLRDAQIEKIDRLCRKLDLDRTDHLLEIGTGWGHFALHAAGEYGCRVTTTTISDEQHALALERITGAGLEDRVTLLKEDYRALEGRFSKLVSVEMIEAVGARYYREFFRRCAERLEPTGTMAIQAITIRDQRYADALRSVDFIQRHIFPGAEIPSVTALCDAATQASDLRLVDLDDIGLHYARTLGAWRERLLARWDDARAMGYSDEFLRLWEFYLVYCEGGFAERHISDVQLVFDKPAARGLGRRTSTHVAGPSVRGRSAPTAVAAE